MSPLPFIFREANESSYAKIYFNGGFNYGS